MPKKNKTACKRRKCQRSRSQRRRQNNNRRTRTIRGGISPFRTPFRKLSEWNTTRLTNAAARRLPGPTHQPARWCSPVRMWQERNNNRVVPDSQIQPPSYNRELASVTNSIHEEASAARRSIINNNKEILKLITDDVLTDNTKKGQESKLQAVRTQERVIRDLEREDARLRSRDGLLPKLPPDNIIPNAALQMNRLSGRVNEYTRGANDAHQTATSALNDQTNILDGKMRVLDTEFRNIGKSP